MGSGVESDEAVETETETEKLKEDTEPISIPPNCASPEKQAQNGFHKERSGNQIALGEALLLLSIETEMHRHALTITKLMMLPFLTNTRSLTKWIFFKPYPDLNDFPLLTLCWAFTD